MARTDVGCNFVFLKSLQGILKLLELFNFELYQSARDNHVLLNRLALSHFLASIIVFCTVALICTFVHRDYWTNVGSTWVLAATILALLVALVFLFLYLCNIIFGCPRAPSFVFYSYVIATLVILSAAITATLATYLFHHSGFDSLKFTTAATAAAAYVAFLIFGIDTLHYFGSLQRNVVETTVRVG